MPPFLDPEFLDDMSPALSKSSSPSTLSSCPLLILSPSSLSHRPQVLESILSAIPSTQPHHLQMLDRIAMNFVRLPENQYKEAVLALPTTEETSGEVDKDIAELTTVFNKVLNALQPGGRVFVGRAANETFTKEAVLAGYLIELENQQVYLTNTTAVYSP